MSSSTPTNDCPASALLPLTLMLALVPSLGCERSGPNATSASSTPSPEAPPASTSPTELRGARLVAAVVFTPARPKVGELFVAQTTLRDASGAPLTATAFKLDATMPSHGHGMMTDPVHEVAADGWRSSGMKLHMHGEWKLEIEATIDGKVERAEAKWQQAPEAL